MQAISMTHRVSLSPHDTQAIGLNKVVSEGIHGSKVSMQN